MFDETGRMPVLGSIGIREIRVIRGRSDVTQASNLISRASFQLAAGRTDSDAGVTSSFAIRLRR